MTESQACIAFNLTEKVGIVTLTKLKAQFGSVAAAWEAYPRKVSRAGGAVDWEQEEAIAAKRGVRIVTIEDRDYPARLKSSPGSPLVLYVRGDVTALSKPFVALVGTRRATAYGKDVAFRFAEGLAKAGWGVVSGLALGIDAESHRGALKANGITVGVIGSGLDQFYPEENIDLARAIVEKGGAVVSEFPFGRMADVTTFPIRNHVVAALASGVVAVECPARSGTLITTEIAADLGRTIMAVPASVNNRMSEGCLRLIRDGATLVRNVDDILQELGGAIKPLSERVEAPAVATSSEIPRFSAEEALVVNELDAFGISMDDLARLTQLPIAKVSALTMGLRIKGIVEYLPGNRVALKLPRA